MNKADVGCNRPASTLSKLQQLSLRIDNLQFDDQTHK